MEKERITVKEYADAIGKSVQAVYNKINNADDPIQQYVIQKKKGKAELKAEILDTIEKKEKETHKTFTLENEIKEEQKEDSAEETTIENKASSQNEIIDILKDQIKHFKIEIEEKNKQIEYLQKALDNNQKMLNNEQQLMLLEKNAVKEHQEESQQQIINTESAKPRWFNFFRRG